MRQLLFYFIPGVSSAMEDLREFMNLLAIAYARNARIHIPTRLITMSLAMTCTIVAVYRVLSSQS